MTKQFLEFIYKYHYHLQHINDFNAVKVVLGNTSCDLDSVVCALVYSFYLHMTESTSESRKVSVIPVLNIQEKDLPIKTEVCYFLKLNNIPLKKLVFRDSLDLAKLSSEKKLELVLVDYHVLPHKDANLASSVVEIIDHRPRDLSVVWKDVKTTIERVGSCASLVGRILLESEFCSLDRTVAQLIAGPIILDTANFSETYGQSTEVDENVYAKLNELWDDLIPPADLFQQLSDAKQDVSSLTAEQILGKDMKVAGSVPIAGFPFLIQDIVSGKRIFENFTQAVADLGTVNKSKLVVLLGLHAGSDANDKIERDLGVYSNHSSISEKFVEFLKNEAAFLQLAPVCNENPALQNLSVFKVLNTKASRKAVLPLVMDFQNRFSDILSDK
nr:PREDICTED: protein prune homolog [Bemisia tabaci]